MANHRRYRYAEAEALTTRRSPLTGTCKTQSPGGQVGSARRSARVFAVIGTARKSLHLVIRRISLVSEQALMGRMLRDEHL